MSVKVCLHIHIWLSSAEEANTSQLSAAEFPNLFAFFLRFFSLCEGEEKEEQSYEEENSRLKICVGFITKNIWRCSY